MRVTFHGLTAARAGELEQLLRAGRRPRPEDLVGWEFRGQNTPAFTKLLGIRRFKKGFEPPRAPGAVLHGYNVRTRQSGLAWTEVLRAGEPHRHGFYAVVEPGDGDALYPNALLLDYGRGENPRYDPSRFLRDYLVQVDADNRDLFLGKAYVALGPRRLPVSYFVLERHNPAG